MDVGVTCDVFTTSRVADQAAFWRSPHICASTYARRSLSPKERNPRERERERRDSPRTSPNAATREQEVVPRLRHVHLVRVRACRLALHLVLRPTLEALFLQKRESQRERERERDETRLSQASQNAAAREHSLELFYAPLGRFCSKGHRGQLRRQLVESECGLCGWRSVQLTCVRTNELIRRTE